LEARAQALEAVSRPLPKLQGSGPLGRQTSDAVMRYSHVLDDALEVVKQQLSSLSAIVQGAPNAMLVLDAQGQISLFNPRVQAWLPAGLVHEGAPIAPVLQHLGCAEETSLAALVGQDHFVMTPGAGAGAGQRYFVLNVIALSPDAGQHMHLLSLLDITDMRTLQAQRERTLELLSHDMRTPVASILSLAQEHAAQASEKIQRHARTLLEMMDDFILSIQAKERDYVLSETLFDDVLDEAIYQVRDLAQQRGMAIDWQESEAGLFVLASPRLLIRVLANVLVNAIRHGEAGSTIDVRIEVLKDAAPSCLRCTVRNRVGLPEAASAGMAHKGFGLGMGFVEEVMHKHRGHVRFDVRRPPGTHAQVCLTLPIAGETPAH
jgi:signal transduction histidine kinase